MISVHSVASRIGVSVTLPELERDIDAQLLALIDPDHPKRAVFLARGNALGDRKLPDGIFVETRPEGTLITDNATMAMFYRQMDQVTDTDVAVLLGYPEPKPDVLEAGDGIVVQTLDRDGCVIFEAISSQYGLRDTMEAAESQVPDGGHVAIVSIETALSRRIAGMN